MRKGGQLQLRELGGRAREVVIMGPLAAHYSVRSARFQLHPIFLVAKLPSDSEYLHWFGLPVHFAYSHVDNSCYSFWIVPKLSELYHGSDRTVTRAFSIVRVVRPDCGCEHPLIEASGYCCLSSIVAINVALKQGIGPTSGRARDWY